MLISLVLTICAVASAQQVYVSTSGPLDPPSCTAIYVSSNILPSYHHSQFSYTQTETVRTAISAQPFPTETYGPPFSEVSHLLPALSTTSWGNWDPAATSTPTDEADPYGQAAYSALWQAASVRNFTRGIYSTTVAPTPVPNAELVVPPPLYFTPAGCYSFPCDFMLGIDSAAAQVEGAVADEGRTPAAPDFLVEFARSIGADTSDMEDDFIATENYYLYKQDIERLASVGIKYYSFNIAWSRILPFTVPGTPVNKQALAHYDDLINFAIEKGVRPVVTLTHFDTPAQFIGGNATGLSRRPLLGYLNLGYQNETFEDAFVHYGKIVMAHFANRVSIWITFNEPLTGVDTGPSIDHIIKSHARLYHFYVDELKGTGKVSIKMGAAPALPQVPSNASHVAATKHYNDLNIGTFLNPLALGQDFPDVYKQTIQDYVPLTQDDLAYLNHTLDFIGTDLYVAPIVSPVVADIAACAANNVSNPYYPQCVSTTEITANGWNEGYHEEYIVYTASVYVRTQLNYLWNTYRMPLVITEFGFSTAASHASAALNDIQFDVLRSEHYLSFLAEVLKSIWEDGVHVTGAFMWSSVDNWEWGTFSHQFGLQHLNRTTQQRVYKRSIFDVVDFVEARMTNSSEC